MVGGPDGAVVPVTAISVVVADANKLFAEALSFLLGRESFTVLGTAHSADDAVALVGEMEPSLAVVGVPLPGADPVSLGLRLRRGRRGLHVLALVHSDGVDAGMLADGDYDGSVRKDSGFTTLIAAVSDAVRGERVFRAGGTASPSRGLRNHAEFLLDQLTPRELEILRLLADGTNSEAIARGLGIKPNTARTHVQNILTKLNVNSRLEAVSLAIREGLMPTAVRTVVATRDEPG